MSAHTELAFEAAVEHCLPTQGRYGKRAPADYAEERSLFSDDVSSFLLGEPTSQMGGAGGSSRA